MPSGYLENCLAVDPAQNSDDAANEGNKVGVVPSPMIEFLRGIVEWEVIGGDRILKVHEFLRDVVITERMASEHGTHQPSTDEGMVAIDHLYHETSVLYHS